MKTPLGQMSGPAREAVPSWRPWMHKRERGGGGGGGGVGWRGPTRVLYLLDGGSEP